MKLIDKDILNKDFYDNCMGECCSCPYSAVHDFDSSACEVVNRQKTVDAVHVVRCKNCKWHDKFYGCQHELMWKSYSNNDDFFCAYREK